jgi:2-methylcitrate dehydratase PrpD
MLVLDRSRVRYFRWSRDVLKAALEDTMTVEDGNAGIAEAMEVTRFLSKRATALRFADIPESAVRVARHCVLDWFGISLAGLSEPLVTILADQLVEDGGNPRASVIGRADRFTLEQAALLNGAISHALDFDDVNMAMSGHATVAILPAVLGVGEDLRIDGRRMIEAFVAGVETASRIGRMVAPSHYSDGWHPTATVGTFGAVAAVSNLLRLDEERTAHAFGIAGTQAAGLKSVFGTMSKPLHAGLASARAIQAARLASKGFTSNITIIECEQGFAATQSRTVRPGDAFVNPPGAFYINQTLFKYHAACYLTQSMIEAIRAMRRLHDIDARHIARVVVRVDPGHTKICDIAAPKTGMELKFSLRAVAALALLGEDTSNERLFCDMTARRSEVVQLRDKVEIEKRTEVSHTLSEVEVHMHDGAVLIERHDTGLPATDLDAQGDALRAKFRTLARPVIGDATKQLAELCETFDLLENVDRLFSLSQPGGAPISVQRTGACGLRPH